MRQIPLHALPAGSERSDPRDGDRTLRDRPLRRTSGHGDRVVRRDRDRTGRADEPDRRKNVRTARTENHGRAADDRRFHDSFSGMPARRAAVRAIPQATLSRHPDRCGRRISVDRAPDDERPGHLPLHRLPDTRRRGAAAGADSFGRRARADLHARRLPRRRGERDPQGKRLPRISQGCLSTGISRCSKRPTRCTDCGPTDAGTR